MVVFGETGLVPGSGALPAGRRSSEFSSDSVLLAAGIGTAGVCGVLSGAGCAPEEYVAGNAVLPG